MFASSHLTQKHQTTIPAKVRKALGLRAGDVLGFELREGGEVVLRKATPLDAAFAKSVEKTLSEWISAEDEEAYRDL
jgi:AbrB family looped-hinge helix DNA binding protein